MRPILGILTLGLLALLAAAPTAVADEDEDRRRAALHPRPCPEIKIAGAHGVHFLGRSNRGFLGVEPSALTPELRRHFGAPEDAGVLVARVIENSAAAAAGLAVGDVITRVAGEEVTSANGLGRAVRQQDGGAEVEIEYWRDRQRYTAVATLGEQERCGIDVGHLPMLELENLEKLGQMGFTINEEALDKLRAINWEEALSDLRDVDWEKHFEGLRVLDVERMEERMERVRERLERLESSLEREHERLQRLEERRKRSGEEDGV